MLDVGQGDSVILMTKDRVLVIDNGSSDRDDAGKLLAKALNYYGIETVDALFLSHADFDHTNGLETLLRSRHCTMKKLVIPGNVGSKKSFAKIKTQAQASGIELLETVSGDVLKFGPFSVRVLSPEQRSEKEGNEGSLVLNIEVNGERFLLTGDISSETEKTLLREEISADILKVPHHGSKYSSSTEFLREVHPKIAFVSYGKRNVYGHPAKETVERLKEQKIDLFKTGEQGAVELTVVHKKYKVRYYK